MDKALRKYKLGKCIGSGGISKCYKYGDDKVIKVYKTYPGFLGNVDLLGIKNDTYIFPDEVIYNDFSEPIAIVMTYIKAKTIENRNMVLDDIIKNVKKVYEDTDKLSEMNISLCDVFAYNILFSDKFYVIDTDRYFKPFHVLGNVSVANIAAFNYAIIMYLNRFEKERYLMDFIKNDKLLSEVLYGSIYDYKHIVGIDEVIKLLISKAEDYTDKQITTVCDLREEIKKKMKTRIRR